MEYKLNIKTSELLRIFSSALDLVSPLISGHQVRVAYIAFRLAKEHGVSKERLDKIVKAGMIHDIGATKVSEIDEIIRPDFEGDAKHEIVGAKYLENSIFKDSAIFVRHHHRAWNYGEGKTFNGYEVPIECQILHLADRIDTYINKSEYILNQVPDIKVKVEGNIGLLFVPELVETFLKLSENESFWLYTVSKNVSDVLFKEAELDEMDLNVDELYQVTKWFANIIDFRSRFTAVHSRGVSTSAGAIATAMNCDAEFVKILEISGFLHDLGKLAVPNTILEKNGKLDVNEYAIIRSHTFHTYNVLSVIKDPNFQLINEYASYHHEKLDGSGYPFHIKGEDMKLGSKIMCVADIFTAIAEDRPYRDAMKKEMVIRVIQDEENRGHLDTAIVKALIDNYDEIVEKMKNSQKFAREEYENFWSNI